MEDPWYFLMNMNLDAPSSYLFPIESPFFCNLGNLILSQMGSFLNNSTSQSSYCNLQRKLTFQERLGCISKFTGALFFFCSSGYYTNCPKKSSVSSHSRNNGTCPQVKYFWSKHISPKLHLGFSTNTESSAFLYFSNAANSALRHLWEEVKRIHPLPFLSLATVLVSFRGDFSSNALAVPMGNSVHQLEGHGNQPSCGDRCQTRGMLSIAGYHLDKDVIEPRTGIMFPVLLDNILDGDITRLSSKVLVGMGSRCMKIIKVKTLRLYAFGLYVQPDSLCQKLGHKYASMSVNELRNQPNFFEDLLREDIEMTLRLVVNFNGLKISSVRDAFKKSLQGRLAKTNPKTDYLCLREFDSYFSHDIPIHVGTTIDFRQTSEGQLITEIDGKKLGAVHSKELCRAFFDMYIGDSPVSLQAKQEIAQNVAGIIRRC